MPSPPEHDDEARFVSGQIGPVHCGSELRVAFAFVIEQRIEVVLSQPLDQVRQQLSEFRLSRLTNNRNAGHAVSVYRFSRQ